MTPLANPDAPAGLPETVADRSALLDRLLAERFPGIPRTYPTLNTEQDVA